MKTYSANEDGGFRLTVMMRDKGGIITPHRLITRAEYMADPGRLHHPYYLEMAKVIPGLKAWILDHWSIDEIRAAYSEDRHLNNLPKPKGWTSGVMSPLGGSAPPWMVGMDLAFKWTKYAIARVNLARDGHQVASYSDNVCAIKAMMRDMIERPTKKEADE